MWILCFILALCSVISGLPSKRADDLFELSVIHFNDFHARFEETNNASGSCTTANCIGGFSRLYHQITEMKKAKPDSIVLDAGDDFQGTIWYTLGKWNVTQEFMNTLPLDASVLGNHEFDDGVAGVVPYIKALNHPVIVSNIDASEEPTIDGLFNKSIVIERNGKKIGIIGVIVSSTPSISSTGKLKFSLESPSVNEEAERLVREEGVFTNIILSHSGYDIDQIIAANASEKISAIIGGHSHTFLYTGDNPPGPDRVGGPYPTVVQSKNGHNVLVVQASAYCKYVGNITVYLDENGEMVEYSGDPIFLDTTVPQDAFINQKMQPWKDLVDAQGEVQIGSSLVTMSKTGCYYQECTLGNFVADSMVYYYTRAIIEGAWTAAAIAITNPGGLRTDVEKGNITYGDMVTAQPFGNTIDVGELEGRYIKELFESNTKSYNSGRIYSDLRLLQVSGVRLVYNLTKPVGEQVQSIKIRCQNCSIVKYEPLDYDKMYRIAVNSFMAGGGDGYTALTDHIQNLVTGPLDMDVLIEYLQHRNPAFIEEDERIVVYGAENIETRNMDT